MSPSLFKSWAINFQVPLRSTSINETQFLRHLSWDTHWEIWIKLTSYIKFVYITFCFLRMLLYRTWYNRGRQTFLEKGQKGANCIRQYKDKEEKTMRPRFADGCDTMFLFPFTPLNWITPNLHHHWTIDLNSKKFRWRDKLLLLP